MGHDFLETVLGLANDSPETPKIAESYYIRGEAYLRAKQWEEAKET